MATVIIRYLALSCVLMQGVLMLASQQPQIDLNKSRDNLRNSGDNVVARSESQELRKKAAVIAVTPYLDSPCGGWISRSIHPQNPMAPWYSDCP